MLARLNFFFFEILSASKTLSRIALRYYRDSVTVILTAPSLQTYVMSRTVREQIDMQSPAGRVQRFKMAIIDPVSPFYPTLCLKKATLQWGNLPEVRKTSL